MSNHYETPLSAATPAGRTDQELNDHRQTTRGRTPSSTRSGVAKPLCVDLDGTLVRTDLLIEGVLALFSDRNGINKLSRLLTTSRAAFKQQIALHAGLPPELLPFNAELIEFLREQKRNGRKIVLATAADERTARAIADHLGLFDDIIASNGMHNLKGEAKAKELVRRYGHKGFDYAGDSRADLAVWRDADGIVIVNASPAVVREARALGHVVAELDKRQAVVAPAIRAMRPHQWVKNLPCVCAFVGFEVVHGLARAAWGPRHVCGLLRGGLGDLSNQRSLGSRSGSPPPTQTASAVSKRHAVIAIGSGARGRACRHRARRSAGRRVKA